VLVQRIESLDDGELLGRQAAVEHTLFRMGVTFTVYGDNRGTEKIFPFDIIRGLCRPTNGRGWKPALSSGSPR